MTEIDEKLAAVHHRLTAAGLLVHAGAVGYQVAVMQAERRTDDQILDYLRQVDEAIDQPVTIPAGPYRRTPVVVHRTTTESS